MTGKTSPPRPTKPGAKPESAPTRKPRSRSGLRLSDALMCAGIAGGLVWLLLHYLAGAGSNTAALVGLPAGGFVLGHLLKLPTSFRVGRRVGVRVSLQRGRRRR